MPLRILDAAATRAALPFQALIPALRALFAAGCVVPPRHVHEIGGARHLAASCRPGSPGRYYGVKIVNIAAGNAARGLPALHASYLLHDATTGAPLALIDGDQITARRTAAASALAASWLARADARHLLVVGAGQVARLLPEAYRTVRPIERVTVWARRAAEAEALARALRERRRRRGGERRSRAGGRRRRRRQRRDPRDRAVDRGRAGFVPAATST